MPTVTIGEQDIFYFEYRVSDSPYPPLLLIHGAGGQHMHWPPQVRRLARAHTIAPDLPGHGRSPGPGRTSIAAYAADLLALMDALGVEQFIPVGHSMVGAIALQIALAAPERVAGIALITTGAHLPVSDALLGNALTNFPALVDFVQMYAWGPHADEKLQRTGRRQLESCPAEVVHGDYLACNNFDARERLAEITCPALVVGATHDRMTPPRLSQFLADNLPGATFYLVEEAGHYLPSEHPHEVAEILSGWLDEQFLPGRT